LFYQDVCPPTKQYPEVYTENAKEFDKQKFRCSIPGALKHIEEKCHDQQICSMVVAPEVFGGGEGGNDPCPQVRKYVEVAYKCKPTQFRSKVECHSQTLELDCNKKLVHKETDDDEQDMERLAIYSATFASSIGSHIYCPDTAITSLSSSSMLDGSIRFTQDASEKQDAEVGQKTCEESYATDAVMKLCHGKRKLYIYALV